jgi:glutamine phosphoribosylpyrophosphate amidotransferase
MCGLAGMVVRGPVAPQLYDALTVLQHRGQDAAGIVTCSHDRFHQRKNEGLVRDVFRQHHMQRLLGSIGIGHVRYPTPAPVARRMRSRSTSIRPTALPWRTTAISRTPTP